MSCKIHAAPRIALQTTWDHPARWCRLYTLANMIPALTLPAMELTVPCHHQIPTRDWWAKAPAGNAVPIFLECSLPPWSVVGRPSGVWGTSPSKKSPLHQKHDVPMAIRRQSANLLTAVGSVVTASTALVCNYPCVCFLCSKTITFSEIGLSAPRSIPQHLVKAKADAERL